MEGSLTQTDGCNSDYICFIITTIVAETTLNSICVKPNVRTNILRQVHLVCSRPEVKTVKLANWRCLAIHQHSIIYMIT
jgi:hydroxymethylpyrimidine/phosphomethylpyrimidine kinase